MSIQSEYGETHGYRILQVGHPSRSKGDADFAESVSSLMNMGRGRGTYYANSSCLLTSKRS